MADSGTSFYAERNDFDLASCSNFVKSVVLPKLGRFPGRTVDADQLYGQLTDWLAQFAAANPKICYDFDEDWRLFVTAMRGNVPSWLTQRNVDDQIDDLAREWFYIENGLDDHHALNDAQANRAAYWGRG